MIDLIAARAANASVERTSWRTYSAGALSLSSRSKVPARKRLQLAGATGARACHTEKASTERERERHRERETERETFSEEGVFLLRKRREKVGRL